ncbi:unnamed protein product [Fraxinus pennsylvanica]|uniref:Uncharacterized protein n=1 Tax=Fraxinus pennsylvanica TaxID=56036 RepID=A0AAD1ZRC2_9LAMI|nr:unnamed protein product [Fraxinus pennsylvanica]
MSRSSLMISFLRLDQDLKSCEKNSEAVENYLSGKFMKIYTGHVNKVYCIIPTFSVTSEKYNVSGSEDHYLAFHTYGLCIPEKKAKIEGFLIGGEEQEQEEFQLMIILELRGKRSANHPKNTKDHIWRKGKSVDSDEEAD